MDHRDWKDEYVQEPFTEISPLLVTQQRDQLISPTIIESLDYDQCPNEPYIKFIASKSKSIIRLLNLKDWIMFSLIGIATGTVAFAIDLGVKKLTKIKFYYSLKYVQVFSNFMVVPILIYVGISLLYCIISSLMVVLTPEAAGSGIPEIKCYLNGIRLPKVVRMKTLVSKAIGVLFSVAGGLPCGKEGPMIHSGAVLGAGIPECLSRLVKKLGYTDSFFGVHDDRAKRDFISAGAAAGVSAAFGAPLGGVLFSLEEGSSFWNQALTWKTLFCSMCSAFVLQILQSTLVTSKVKINDKYSGLINFGEFKCDTNDEDCLLWGLEDLVLFVLMGAVGGLLGALFNHLNLALTRYRVKHVNPKGKIVRALEVALIGVVISTLIYTSTTVAGSCVRWNKNGTSKELENLWRKGWCPGDSSLYNDYGTIAFNSQEDSIKILFHHFNHSRSAGSDEIPLSPTYNPLTLVVFFIILFFSTCWTYGIGVPSGLFVPCLLIGATYGRIVAYVYQYVRGETRANLFYPGSYALIGAAAFLGGVVRMTISLTVILIETTRNISYGLPIMLTLMVAKWVGDLFNKGLYDEHIELKNWPLLEWEADPIWETVRASDIMKSSLEWVNPTPTVGRVVDILKRTKHSAFPVCVYTDRSSQTSPSSFRSQLRLKGLILRSQIVTILKKEHFRDIGEQIEDMKYSELTEFYPRYPDIDDITLTVADQNKVIDCCIYMNPSPYTVSPHAPLTKVFTLFRSLGLRHLIVVNNKGEVEGMITRAELQEHYLEHVYSMKKEADSSVIVSNPTSDLTSIQHHSASMSPSSIRSKILHTF